MHDTQVLPLSPWPTMFSLTLLCVQGHCHAEKGLRRLITVKCNGIQRDYKDIIVNCLLPTLWQQFGKGPYLGVKVLQSFSLSVLLRASIKRHLNPLTESSGMIDLAS